jgi:cell division protein FtsQ
MPRHTPIYSSLEGRERLLGEASNSVAAHKPGRVLRWILFLVLLGLLFFGIQNAYSALTGSDLFRLEQISVVGNRLLTPRDVALRSGLETGDPLLEVDLAAAGERVGSHPLIRETLLVRQPPEGLVITVAERRLVALISISEGLFGLDREGAPVALPQISLDLPVVTGIEEVASDSAGHQPKHVLSRLAGFLETLRAREPTFLDDISEVHIESTHEARVYMVGDGLELRMRFENADRQVRNFHAYLAGGAGQAKAPAYVDLRFWDQVVVGKR